MKNKIIAIIVSVLLVVATVFTISFAGCKHKIPDSTSSSTPGNEEPPIPVVIPDDPEDRSQYTFDKLKTNIGNLYVNDIINNPNVLTDNLQGFMLGDVFSEVMTTLITAAETALPVGINLEMLDLEVYRGNDGKWYRAQSKSKVNGCLNNILNYKLDGTGELKIDYTLYGERTLAYIFFDYSPSDGSTYDRNWMLGKFFETSPMLNGIANTTLNELKTLLTGTTAQRSEIIVKNFGDVQIGTFFSMFVTDADRNNGFINASLKITIAQANSILTSTPQESYLMLAEIYKNVYLADVFNIDETMPGYIREIHTMTLSGIFNGLANGTLKDYVLDCAGALTLNKIIRANLSQDPTLISRYETFYAKYRAMFDLTLADLINATTGATTPDQAMQNMFGKMYDSIKSTPINGTLTIDMLVSNIASSITYDDLGNIVGIDLFGLVDKLLANNATDLDSVVVFETVTAKTLVENLKNSFTTDELGNQTFDVNTFFTNLETAVGDKVDGVSNVLVNMPYAQLKQMVTSWFTVEADGTYDMSKIITDIIEIAINKVLIPQGYYDAFITWLTQTAGQQITADNFKQVITSMLENLSGEQGANLENIFQAQTGESLSAVLDEIALKLTDVNANVYAEVINFMRKYANAIITIASNNTTPNSSWLKDIIANNTTTDANGNAVVDYQAVMTQVAEKILTDIEVQNGTQKVVSFVDSEGISLDVTISDCVALIKAINSNGDIKAQLLTIFEGVKVNTLLEYVTTLIASQTPTTPTV